MTRLAEETGDAFGLSLLQSARGDAPSAEARERTAVALGVTVATTAAAITTAITTATTTAATTA